MKIDLPATHLLIAFRGVLLIVLRDFDHFRYADGVQLSHSLCKKKRKEE